MRTTIFFLWGYTKKRRLNTKPFVLLYFFVFQKANETPAKILKVTPKYWKKALLLLKTRNKSGLHNSEPRPVKKKRVLDKGFQISHLKEPMCLGLRNASTRCFRKENRRKIWFVWSIIQKVFLVEKCVEKEFFWRNASKRSFSGEMRRKGAFPCFLGKKKRNASKRSNSGFFIT